jgi:hypothetical protein
MKLPTMNHAISIGYMNCKQVRCQTIIMINIIMITMTTWYNDKNEAADHEPRHLLRLHEPQTGSVPHHNHNHDYYYHYYVS